MWGRGGSRSSYRLYEEGKSLSYIEKKIGYRSVNTTQELIKVNALQVSPAEFEMTLIESPDIEDAAVAGLNL